MQQLSKSLKRRSVVSHSAADGLPAVLRILISWLEWLGDQTWLKRRSAFLVGTAACVLIVVLALVDKLADLEISLLLFYVLIVGCSEWFGGGRAGVIAALASSFALLLHQNRVLGNEPKSFTEVWNFWTQIGVCMSAALLTSFARTSTETLRRQLKQRANELERELSDRLQTEEQLVRTLQQLRQLAENIADAFWIRNVDETRLIYVSPAYEKIWGRSCKEVCQSARGWLETIHADDRERIAQAVKSKQASGDYNEEYRIVAADSTQRWIRDRAFPIRDSTGKIIRVVGIAEDITERKLLERDILEISDREQARIGQDLHDGLCQKLVSLAFDANSLEEKLAIRGLSESDAVRRISSLLDEMITEARALSGGLFPVQLETDGLTIALKQLCETVSVRGQLTCQFDCPCRVLVRDNTTATHLYRIAQEAVNNAVKHSGARAVNVRLESGNRRIELRVIDDGNGIPEVVTRRGGMGMHIMNYRARTIGGTLTLGRGPVKGTVVTCTVPHPEE